jgi:pyrroline-5-carboxylate reductase
MSQALSGKKIVVIGGGNMGAAIIQGLLREGGTRQADISVVEPTAERRQSLSDSLGIVAVSDGATAVSAAEIVLLAVKPQILAGVVEALRSSFRPGQLVVSVAAGVSTPSLEACLPAGARVVRAMPNTPALVRAGITALCAGATASEADLGLSEALFAGIGKTVRVPESQMNAVTGLSGSGPAYVMLFIESLADGGVQAGLPRTVALELALATVLGSSRLLEESAQHPAQVKDMVTSPGGTTIAGVRALEAGGFRSAVIEAVNAATNRAVELGAKK